MNNITTSADLAASSYNSTFVSEVPTSTGVANPSVGMVRFNFAAQQLEIYTGVAWQFIPTVQTNISLSPYAESVLHWAGQKKIAEENLTNLMRFTHPNPAIQDAVQELKNAMAKFDEATEKLQVLTTLLK